MNAAVYQVWRFVGLDPAGADLLQAVRAINTTTAVATTIVGTVLWVRMDSPRSMWSPARNLEFGRQHPGLTLVQLASVVSMRVIGSGVRP